MPTKPSEPGAAPRILVGICSCRANRDKRDAVRETWLSRPGEGIECLFFVGGGEPLLDELDVMVLAVDDGYDHLPLKVRTFFARAIATNGFDWLFKCDDDTYVALERLRGLVDGRHELVGNEYIGSRGFPDGGAGYLLSRRLVRILADDPELPDTGAEDVIIGQAAIRHGARAVETTRLCLNRSRHPLPENDTITSHLCTPDHLRAVHAMLCERPMEVDVVHPFWRDRLRLYPSGFFSRCSTSCRGRWSQDDGGVLHLKWFDWKEETFVREGGFFRSSDPDSLHAVRCERPVEVEVVHPCWRDRLRLYPSGYFSRCSTSCRGRWSEGDGGVLHLKWSDWKEETFVREGEFYRRSDSGRLTRMFREAKIAR